VPLSSGEPGPGCQHTGSVAIPVQDQRRVPRLVIIANDDIVQLCRQPVGRRHRHSPATHSNFFRHICRATAFQQQLSVFGWYSLVV
jgi:hypothetical protein